jgi:hypothetical protein
MLRPVSMEAGRLPPVRDLTRTDAALPHIIDEGFSRPRPRR